MLQVNGATAHQVTYFLPDQQRTTLGRIACEMDLVFLLPLSEHYEYEQTQEHKLPSRENFARLGGRFVEAPPTRMLICLLP
jgi:hypothetical protein